MALTKLPKGGLGTGSVSSDQIEDGTIQNLEFEDGTITAAKLSSTIDLSSKTVTLPDTSVTNDQLAGSIANDKLSNSSFTLNGTAVSLGGSINPKATVDWQSVKTSDFTAVAGEGYIVDTSSAAVTVTLPASASLGDTIAIKDYAGTFATNNCTIGRNGHNIQGATNNSVLSTNRASVVLVYVDATKGWLYTDEHNVANLQSSTFITATGGTETTTGDFKIHTFTSSGCFVVSTIGVGALGGPSNVDYLVVAGGGGAGAYGAGGGGAGGHRTSFPSPGCNAGAFPISAQSYPITVGAGGVGGDDSPAVSGSPGSNSIFSTITSAGGGKGAGGQDPRAAGSGGSGGGGDRDNTSAGSGNTPPVSPSQGNPGGTGIFAAPNYGGGGGGGAGASGGNGTSGSAGNGGNGLANSITGASVTRAGGGGGGTFSSASGGSGGSGGGGSQQPDCGQSGTANTGGGGGSNVYTGGVAGAGGSGIVIIRYKYQ